MKLFQKICTILLAAPVLLQVAYAQAGNTKQVIDAKHYVFKANSVSPASGGLRQLTPGYYTLKVKGDTLIADLPYFGQAYQAPVDPAKSGLSFKTLGYNQNVENKKKHWNITLKPNDASEANGVTQLYLTVYNNGSATLQVVSLNRQAISFYGVVEKINDNNHNH